MSTRERQHVAMRIKERRHELRLSQRDIAEEGTSYAYISRIESGDRRPSLDALIAIAGKLKVTGLWLLTGDTHAHCPLCQRKGR